MANKEHHKERIADKTEAVMLLNSITTTLTGLELADQARVIAEIDRAAASVILRRRYAAIYHSLSDDDRMEVGPKRELETHDYLYAAVADGALPSAP